MTLEELRNLIADDEGETVEVKETTGQRGDACETLCAFLNKDGGTVVFGVTKKGKLAGQILADTTKRDLFEVFQKFEPAADIEVSYVPVDDTHTAIVCHVDAGNRKPYIYDGKPYKRVQSSTTVMSQEEYERMLLARGGFRSEWEDQPNPELSLDDLDLEVIRDTARKAVRAGRLDESVDTEDAASLLDHFKLRKNGTLLNGAAVLFGKAYGCVTTVFRRPDWTGANTPDQRTGTGVAITGTTPVRTGTVGEGTGTVHVLSGTRWTIIGTPATDSIVGLLARLPKLRKDARANVETVLHELISDKNATIPQICARTGMALRTINNALATLRAAKIVLPREAAEKQPIGTEKLHIGDEKQPIESEKSHIGPEKPHIGDEKPHIDGKLTRLGLTHPTEENIIKLFRRFGLVDIFGRKEVRDTTGLQDRASSALIAQMLRLRLLDTVKGHGKGKYRFRSEI